MPKLQETKSFQQQRHESDEVVVHIIDDDAHFRVALGRQVRVAAGYLVRTYGSAEEFLRAQLEDRPGCILLDYVMPGSNGLDLQKALADRSEPLPIIFLSARADIPISVEAMKAGAMDFLTKPLKNEELIPALRSAIARSMDTRFMRKQLVQWRTRHETLSPREMEVLVGVAAGKKNNEIAHELGISLRTTKAHRGQVMKKMGVVSVAELVHINNELNRHGPGSAAASASM
jgi:FixJ family two-component response regulator